MQLDKVSLAMSDIMTQRRRAGGRGGLPTDNQAIHCPEEQALIRLDPLTQPRETKNNRLAFPWISSA